MPSSERSLDRATLQADLEERVFGSTSETDYFGLEVEIIPFHWQGNTPHHVPIDPPDDGALHSRSLVFDFARKAGIGIKFPTGELEAGRDDEGQFSFEPGGQIEVSDAPRSTPRSSYERTAAHVDAFTRAAAAHNIDLATIGLNPFLNVDTIGLNTTAPRYAHMDAVYQSIGPYGRRMMRQSATVHVNIDMGPGERGRERWRAAQLLSPLAMATFAHSPIADGALTEWKSYRGRIWTAVDPSRCGFPRRFVDGSTASPTEQYLDFALAARLLMIDDGGTWRAQTAARSFDAWMRDGAYGVFPTIDDWHHHLTTLFPEVRPRGFLELRSTDAQHRTFWSAPLVWWAVLLCDDVARRRVLDRLGPSRADLLQRYTDGACHGMASPLVGDDAAFVFQEALDGMSRLPDDYFSEAMRQTFSVYHDRFVARRRTPADDLIDAVTRHGLTRDTLHRVGDAWSSLDPQSEATSSDPV